MREGELGSAVRSATNCFGLNHLVCFTKTLTYRIDRNAYEKRQFVWSCHADQEFGFKEFNKRCNVHELRNQFIS